MRFFLCFLLFALAACSSKKETVSTEIDLPKEEVVTAPFSIDYKKIVLGNGLEVVLHKDDSDPIVAVATIINVGSNREKPGKTGFAHFFEHMSFNDSENVPRGWSRKQVPEWGGSRNGGTWSDGTIYYEVVPKDAFEKILWMDSDRLGYMINTVTTAALEREKQVVKNEKRQRVDNAPYGYTDEIIRKNLYPEGHPYNWTVIGSLPDLQAATLDDVKEFYNQYYGAGNATLAIVGDIDIEKTKTLVERWFGEIKRGPTVPDISPIPVVLEKSKKLYFEDNFAKLPELRMVFSTVENYHPDSYALQVLGSILSGSRNSPLYKEIVEEQELAPNISSYQNSNGVAGEFIIRTRANAGTSLQDVHMAIEKAFANFEQSGFKDTELNRIKAKLETGLYQGIETVLNKAFQLAIDNEFAGDPSRIVKDAELTNAVTKADVIRVYNTYIKGKNFVMTSFVPQGQSKLKVAGSIQASVWQEEIKADVAHEEVSAGEEATYEKTSSKYSRKEPEFGDNPLIKMPGIWLSNVSNGLQIMGIESNELPLVSFDITFPGGQWLDPMDKVGVASLFADLMMEGTINKTPAELEEAIELLGASIDMSSNAEEIRISGSCLSRNFDATIELVTEILMEPRWDETEYTRLKQALETSLKGREANPAAISYIVFNKLLYGNNHIFSLPSSGTLETAANITLNDVKAYYNKLSPKNATMHVSGAINKSQVMHALQNLSRWNTAAPEMPKYTIKETEGKGKLFFIDVPGSKQSVLRIGKLALSAEDDDYTKLDFANEIIGGGSSGELFQTLRIEKGYTYGAYSGISSRKEIAPFQAQSSVRANVTLASLEIMKDMIANYSTNYDENDAAVTKNKVVKANTRAFEGLNAKLNLLRTISKYNRDLDFVEKDQKTLMDMSVEDFKQIIDKYLNENEMVYLVVGDGETQRDEVEKLGKPVIDLDIHGNMIERKVSN